jgi:hypothetical protein
MNRELKNEKKTAKRFAFLPRILQRVVKQNSANEADSRFGN